MRGFAASALGRIGDPAAIAALNARLKHERDRWCKGQIQTALRRIAHRGPLGKVVDAALGGPGAVGRVAVLDGLDVLETHGVGKHLAALEQREPKIHAECLESIREHRASAAVPLLLAMLASEHAATRTDAHKLLIAITRANHGFDPAASPRERQAALVRWQEWWREHLAAWTTRR